MILKFLELLSLLNIPLQLIQIPNTHAIYGLAPFLNTALNQLPSTPKPLPNLIQFVLRRQYLCLQYFQLDHLLQQSLVLGLYFCLGGDQVLCQGEDFGVQLGLVVEQGVVLGGQLEVLDGEQLVLLFLADLHAHFVQAPDYQLAFLAMPLLLSMLVLIFIIH